MNIATGMNMHEHSPSFRGFSRDFLLYNANGAVNWFEYAKQADLIADRNVSFEKYTEFNFQLKKLKKKVDTIVTAQQSTQHLPSNTLY